MTFKPTFSPSAAHRWMNCPGSWGLEKEAPQGPPGESAMVGTVVHAIIEYVLKGARAEKLRGLCGIMKDGWFDSWGSECTLLRKGEIAIPITSKMIEDAMLCVGVVQKILEKRPTAQLYTEQRLKIIPDTMNGSADIVIIDYDEDWGCIIDYKNGVGHVEVEHNPQLMLYGYGAGEYHEMECRVLTNWTLAVVQPNDRDDSRAVRTWKTTAKELGDFFDQACEAIQACKIAYASDGDEKYFKAGSWCQWCAGETRCPVQKKALLKTAQVELPDLPDAGTNPAAPMRASAMTPNQLSWVMDNASAIESMIKQVKVEAQQRALNGEPIPGYKLVESRTRRKVTDPAGLEQAAELEGWEIWDRKLAPFKKLDKEVPKEELKKYVTKPQGVPVLAPETDKRPALENEIGSLPELEN